MDWMLKFSFSWIFTRYLAEYWLGCAQKQSLTELISPDSCAVCLSGFESPPVMFCREGNTWCSCLSSYCGATLVWSATRGVLQIRTFSNSLLPSCTKLGPERAKHPKQASCQEPAVSVKAEPTVQGANAGAVLGVLWLISFALHFEVLWAAWPWSKPSLFQYLHDPFHCSTWVLVSGVVLPSLLGSSIIPKWYWGVWVLEKKVF